LELIYKNIEDKYLLRSLFLRMCLDGLAAVKFLFSNGFSHFFAIIRAHLHFYRLLPEIRQKRRKLRTIAHDRNSEGVYLGSIVASYFLKKKRTFREIIG
jgi:hypothetical protein